MSAWQLVLIEQLVKALMAAAPDPREFADDLIDWAQKRIRESPNKVDDLALPILNELEQSFGDPSD